MGRAPAGNDGAEYIGLIAEEPEATKDTYDDAHDFEHGDTEQWANHVRRHSTMSEGTLFGPHSPHSDKTINDWNFAPRISLLSRVMCAVFDIVERALLVAALGLVLTGIVVYTGQCGMLNPEAVS